MSVLVSSTAAAAERFTPYGTAHLTALVVLVLGGCLLVALGRATRERDPDDRAGRLLAAVCLCVTLPLQVLYFTPEYWDLEKTLPLQLCDVASLVSAYALWTHRPWAVSLTYFWGLTLTTQAILTPDLAAVFPHPVFLLYWAMHLMIVWAAVHLVWGRGERPDWRHYRTSLVLTAGWAACVFAFNVVLGTNYGYLNGKPSAASALDLLGPWPWYLVAETVVVAAVWALMTWPWAGRSPRTGPSSSVPVGEGARQWAWPGPAYSLRSRT